jgi:hypothetical protein
VKNEESVNTLIRLALEGNQGKKDHIEILDFEINDGLK